jgi:hypothetical protein
MYSKQLIYVITTILKNKILTSDALDGGVVVASGICSVYIVMGPEIESRHGLHTRVCIYEKILASDCRGLMV